MKSANVRWDDSMMLWAGVGASNRTGKSISRRQFHRKTDEDVLVHFEKESKDKFALSNGEFMDHELRCRRSWSHGDQWTYDFWKWTYDTWKCTYDVQKWTYDVWRCTYDETLDANWLSAELTNLVRIRRQRFSVILVFKFAELSKAKLSIKTYFVLFPLH